MAKTIHPAPPAHDTLARRLSQILIKLNGGEALQPRALAEEFGVDLRTIQRDLHQRLSYLPLHKDAGGIRLDPAFLGKLDLRDVRRFAAVAGVQGLFPELSTERLRGLLAEDAASPPLVRGYHYENFHGAEPLFDALQAAIDGCLAIQFDYAAATGSAVKAFEVEPYRLINQKGIWYLAARHGAKLKTFGISRIRALNALNQRYKPDAGLRDRIQREEGVWPSEKSICVTVSVSAEVAFYFRRRNLIANQALEQELADGGLILSARVGHPQEIVPVVRHWIPHLRILNPPAMQQELENGLLKYLGANVPEKY